MTQDDSTDSRASLKQTNLLRYISSFIETHGYGPSYRDVMTSLDYKSVSTVAIHINNLVAKGYLRKNGRSARSLEVTAKVNIPESNPQSADDVGRLWLIEQVDKAFNDLAPKPTAKQIDNLYVLVGCVHVLGFKSEAKSYKSRLKALELR